MKPLSIGEAAKKLRVSVATLRRWEKSGRISATRMASGHRRYTTADLDQIISPKYLHQSPSPSPSPVLQTPIFYAFPRPIFSKPQKNILAFSALAIIISLITIGIKFLPFTKYKQASRMVKSGAVLASQTVLEDLALSVNVPAKFNKGLTVGDTIISQGDITAPNILYSLTAGDNITITPGQTPTVSASDQTAALGIFKTIKVGSSSFSAGSNTDTLTFAAGDNASVSINTSDKKITFSATVPSTGFSDDGTMIRLTTAGDIVSLGSATGSAKLSLESSDSRDILTASSAGNLLLKLSQSGTLTLNGSLIMTGNLTTGGSGSVGFWQRADGAVAPTNITDDLLVGGTATSSALFKIVGTTGRLANILEPTVGSTYDIGSSARRWATVYGDTGNFTNFSSSTTTISGTTAEDFLINTDYTGDDAQSSTLTFERGSPATNAQFKWNSDTAKKYLSANTPFAILPDTGIAAGGTAALIINQPFAQDILSASASGTTRFTVDTSGNIKTATWQGTGIGAVYGGTGQTTWTTGDILYASGTNTLSKLSIGSTSQVLSVTAGLPAWTTTSSSNWQRNSGTLAPLNITDDLTIGGIATASAKFQIYANTGSATISGTLSLAPKLQVDAGTCNAASAGKQYYDAANTKYYYCNGTNWFPVGETSGQISAFATTCPSGWTEYTAARGRTVVGTPASGTIAGTVGTALTNLGTRTITDVPAHTHSVDPPNTSTSTNQINASFGGGGSQGAIDADANISFTKGLAGSSHAHSVDIAAFNSDSTGVASVDVTMPYIQLTYCQKDTGSDLAEWIGSNTDISAATIVSTDPQAAEKVIPSTIPYDPHVVGIVATKPGWLIGDPDTGGIQMALIGRVPTRVSLQNGDIKIGDAITTSDIPGVGMKATKPGWIIGKAMQDLIGDTSTVSTITVFLDPVWQDGVGEENLQVKVASISAELAQLRLTPEASNWQYSTESGKLTASFPVQVSEMTITGKLSVGLLQFDDLESSISSLTGTINIKGDLTINGKLRVLGSSIGEVVLPTGLTEITVDSASTATSSSIFVTPEDPTSISAKVLEPGKFVIKIPSSLPADLTIKWWIIN